MKHAISSPLALEICGVSKAYGTHFAVRDLELAVRPREVLTIFGPNGSGKTTLLKLAATLLRPTDGIIRIMGLDTRLQAPYTRRFLGFLSHRTILYEDLTIAENLRFYSRMFELDRSRERITELADDLGLTQHLDHRVRTLSHGMRQRCSIARTLLHYPAVLLLDEPETGLDQTALGLLDRLLEKHCLQGGAVLMATHNLERGLGLANSVAILSGGRLVYREEREAVNTRSFRKIYTRLTGVME